MAITVRLQEILIHNGVTDRAVRDCTADACIRVGDTFAKAPTGVMDAEHISTSCVIRMDGFDHGIQLNDVVTLAWEGGNNLLLNVTDVEGRFLSLDSAIDDTFPAMDTPVRVGYTRDFVIEQPKADIVGIVVTCHGPAIAILYDEFAFALRIVLAVAGVYYIAVSAYDPIPWLDDAEEHPILYGVSLGHTDPDNPRDVDVLILHN